MKIKYLLPMLLTATLMNGCTFEPIPELTPLDIQSIQTRDYENPKEVVFPSVISVFQDLGYTITNADLQTGLIYAESTTQSDSSPSLVFFDVPALATTTQTKATAYIETIQQRTKVRLNFVEVSQSSSDAGQSNRQDTRILDTAIYQNAFERIANAIFIRSSN